MSGIRGGSRQFDSSHPSGSSSRVHTSSRKGIAPSTGLPVLPRVSSSLRSADTATFPLFDEAVVKLPSGSVGAARIRRDSGRLITSVISSSPAKRSTRQKSPYAHNRASANDAFLQVSTETTRSGRKSSPLSTTTSSVGKEPTNKRPYKQKVFCKAGIWGSPSPYGSLSSTLIARREEREKERLRAKGPKKGNKSQRIGFSSQDTPLAENTPAIKPITVRSLATSAVQSVTGFNPPDIFPPLPVHWGLNLIYGETKEFRLPFDIISDWEEGALEGKKVPSKFIKLRRNVFVDRKPRYHAEWKAICHCEPDSGCGPNCINRAMNYLCGKMCPCGSECTNGSLGNRIQKPYKLVWTGSRGFGVQLSENAKAGDFIMDYRGDVISMDTFYQRIRTVYAGRKDFYALEYDADEVIDSGIRGNDGRFINHSCDPNIEVRKYQTMGQGFVEYEVGFWAKRDIEAGEEIFYNYNFDSFTTIRRPKNHPEYLEAPLERRQRCYCGAHNCSGWLGKESSSDLALSLADHETADGFAESAVVPRASKSKMQNLRMPLPAPQSELYAGETNGSIGIRPEYAPHALGRYVRRRRPVSLNAAQGLKGTPKWRAAILAIKLAVPLSRSIARKAALLHRMARLKRNAAPHTSEQSRSGLPADLDLAAATLEREAIIHPSIPGPALRGRKKPHYGVNWATDADLQEQRRRRIRGDVWLEAQKAAMLSTLRAREAVMPADSLASSAPSQLVPPRLAEDSSRSARSSIRQNTDFMSSFLERREPLQPRKPANVIVNMVRLEVPPSGVFGGLLHGPSACSRSPTDTSQRRVGLPKTASFAGSTEQSATRDASRFDKFLTGFIKLSASRLGMGLTNLMLGDCQRPVHSPKSPLAPMRHRGLMRQSSGEQPYDTGEIPEDYLAGNDAGEEYGDAGTDGDQYAADEGEEPDGGGSGGVGAPGGSGGGGGDGDDDPDDEPGNGDGDGVHDENDPEDEDEDLQRRLNAAISPEVLILAPEDVILPEHEGLDLSMPEELSMPEDLSMPEELAMPEDLEAFESLPHVQAPDILEALQLSATAPKKPRKGKVAKQTSSYVRPLDKTQASTLASLAADPSIAEMFPGLDVNAVNMPYELEDGQLVTQSTEDLVKEKKRRKKWTLPLDDATIEAERRKKKKGRRWLLDMLEAAAKKRADMIAQGIPIPSPPPQLPEELPEAVVEPHVLSELIEGTAGPEAVPEEVLAEETAGPLEEANPLEAQVVNETDPSMSAEHVTLAEAFGDEDGVDPELASELSAPDFDQEVVDTAALEDLNAMLLAPGDNPSQPPHVPSEVSAPPGKVKKPRKPKASKAVLTEQPIEEEHSSDNKPRKPRPARRFKTPLTRMRPKLEAALGDFSHLTQAEEEAALEGERRRRKKGTVWLDAMKALAKAKRDAQAKLAQGLKPDEFVLPPTSLPVSGRRKTKKNLEALAARAAEEISGAFGRNISTGPQVGTSSGVSGHHLPLSTTMPEIPDFMYPPDHPSRQKAGKGKLSASSERQPSNAIPSIPLPAFFEERLAAERLAAERAEAAAASANAIYREATMRADGLALTSTSRDAEASLHNGLLRGQAGPANNLAINGFGNHSNIFSNGPDYSGIPGFDLSALRNYTHQDDAEAEDDADQDAPGELDDSPLVKAPFPDQRVGVAKAVLPGSAQMLAEDRQAARVQADLRHTLMTSTLEPLAAAYGKEPATPSLIGGRKRSLSPGDSVTSEGPKKRGPAVKKLAGAAEEPLTDEQWEIERKKRKKGHAWVAGTKAAAEAERAALQAAQARGGDHSHGAAGRRWASAGPSTASLGLPNPSTSRYGSHHVPTSQEEEDDRMLELAFGGPPRPRESTGTVSRPNQRPADIIPYPSSHEVAEPSPDIFAFPSAPSPFSPQHNSGLFMMPPVHVGHMSPLGINNNFGLPLMQHSFPHQQMHHNSEFQ